MDQATALVQAVGGLMWPLVAIIAVVLFRNAVRDLLGRDEVSVSGPGGFALTAKRREVAAQELVAATGSKGDERLSPADAYEQIGEVESVVRELGRSPRILWVDDRPSNNRSERAALESMGIVVELSTSTEDALAIMGRREPFDVVISDMGRPEGTQAGYDLLSQMRARSIETPFIIYASSRSAEHFDEAVRRGALGCTNQPSELIDMVTKALRLPVRAGGTPTKSRGWSLRRAS